MTISIYQEIKGKDIWLCISNPISPKQSVATSGKGLANLTQRYKILCSKEIVIEKDSDRFTVKLPLIYE